MRRSYHLKTNDNFWWIFVPPQKPQGCYNSADESTGLGNVENDGSRPAGPDHSESVVVAGTFQRHGSPPGEILCSVARRTESRSGEGGSRTHRERRADEPCYRGISLRDSGLICRFDGPFSHTSLRRRCLPRRLC